MKVIPYLRVAGLIELLQEKFRTVPQIMLEIIIKWEYI
jgi:hypothetical protein